MAITSTRPARYRIGDHVSFITRGTTRQGLIVGREPAEHRRGLRASDGHLYLVKADSDGEYVEITEAKIAGTVEAEECATA